MPSNLESELETLKIKLEVVAQKKKELVILVDDLSSEVNNLTARDADLKTLNYLMDVLCVPTEEFYFTRGDVHRPLLACFQEVEW